MMKLLKRAILHTIDSCGYQLRHKPAHLVAIDQHQLNGIYGREMYRETFSARSIADKGFYNFGSGNWRHPMWTNIDYASDYYHYDQALIDLPWDITSATPLPVTDGSAELGYCSHTVEHLLNNHVDHMLQEACRILKPGGVLRVTTPNIALYFEAWRRRDIFFNYHYGVAYPFGGDPSTFTRERMSIWLVNEMASQLVQTAHPGHTPKYLDQAEHLDRELARGTLEEVCDRFNAEIDFDLQRISPGHHVNWWTNAKLCAAMQRAGFSKTIVSVAGGAIAPAMRDPVYFDKVNPTFSIFVDGVK